MSDIRVQTGRHRTLLVVLCLILVSLSSTQAADDTATEELRHELQALKARVAELEEKLQKVEKQEREEDTPQLAQKDESEQPEQKGEGDPESEDLRKEVRNLADIIQITRDEFAIYQAQAEQTITTRAAAVYRTLEEIEGIEGIRVHGALRTQYSYEDFNASNRDRGGDIDFDMARINFDGSLGNVLFSGEYRFYQFMNVIHHGWVGYKFTDYLTTEAGIHQVPFGNLPFNSHNFFFSSNYYLGLEDDYDMGAKILYQRDPWDLQLAFYKNDEQGGVDGFVDNRSDRYSFDVVGFRDPDEGTFADPANEIGETNTFNGRLAYKFRHTETYATEVGISGQYGDLHNGSRSVGDNSAYAAHLNGFYGPWNLQLQATRYEYDTDSGANRMAVGAFSFFDSFPAEATTYTANVAYDLPVYLGPVSNITFYNNFSLITDKPVGLDDTWMNVAGFSVLAGGLFAYFDFVTAENQPFIGGSTTGNSSDTNFRFNLNLGYYF